MIKIPVYFILCLLLLSCSVNNSETEGGLSVVLFPEQVQMDNKPNVQIHNLTASTAGYICGHQVEVLIDGAWENHTVTGCSYGFPVLVSPFNSHSQKITLFVNEPGTYRVIIYIAHRDELKLLVSNSIEVIE